MAIVLVYRMYNETNVSLYVLINIQYKQGVSRFKTIGNNFQDKIEFNSFTFISLYWSI